MPSSRRLIPSFYAKDIALNESEDGDDGTIATTADKNKVFDEMYKERTARGHWQRKYKQDDSVHGSRPSSHFDI